MLSLDNFQDQMETKEVVTPSPATKSPVKPPDPILPRSIDVEPTFIYRMIAERRGISVEEAREWFNKRSLQARKCSFLAYNQPDPEIHLEESAGDSTIPKESFWNRKFTRRGALKIGAAATLATGAALAESQLRKPSLVKGVFNWILGNRDKRLEQSKKESSPKVDIEPKPDYAKLNLILKKKPESEERKALELQYVKDVKTLEQIDIGLYAVNNWILRAALIEKRYQLRLEGKYGLRKLTESELKFAKDNNLHPEFVAICTDSYFEAKSMLSGLMAKNRQEFFEHFRPDLLREVRRGTLPQEAINNLEVEDLLPNPGMLIGLVWNESRAMFKGNLGDLPAGIKIQPDVWYGGANIGDKPALEVITGNDKDDVLKGLNKLIAQRNAEGKNGGISLEYDIQNLAASGETGDIGSAQFRPNTAWTLDSEILRPYFNFPLHPNSLKAITAAILYLSSGFTWYEKAAGETKSKYGFINEKLKKMPKIIEELSKKPKYSDSVRQAIITQLGKIQSSGVNKWNPALEKSLFEWDRKYQEDIIDKGKFAEIAELSQRKAA